jgi:hypothetical protein
MQSDGRIDQIAAERAQPRKRPLLVGPGEATEADYVGGQDSGKLPLFGHGGAASAFTVMDEAYGGHGE